jgi:hypothetical protein
MEVVIAALIAGATAVLVAILSRDKKRASRRADEMRDHLATNGSNLPLGELVELIAANVNDTKNAVRRVERKVDQHCAAPASAAHPEEG